MVRTEFMKKSKFKQTKQRATAGNITYISWCIPYCPVPPVKCGIAHIWQMMWVYERARYVIKTSRCSTLGLLVKGGDRCTASSGWDQQDFFYYTWENFILSRHQIFSWDFGFIFRSQEFTIHTRSSRHIISLRSDRWNDNGMKLKKSNNVVFRILFHFVS